MWYVVAYLAGCTTVALLAFCRAASDADDASERWMQDLDASEPPRLEIVTARIGRPRTPTDPSLN